MNEMERDTDQQMPTVMDEQVARRTRGPLFGRFAKGALLAMVALFVVGAVFAWRTNDAMGDLQYLRRGGAAGGGPKSVVDDSPWKTAQTLTALAVTQEELTYAHQAEHLADHEVDQAFATALRSANLRQRTLTGEALGLQQKVTQLQALVKSDQAALASVENGGDDEQIAQAQLGLDTDELNDAKGDLARASGDDRDEIQQELTARQATMKKYDDAGNGGGEVASISVKKYRTLAGLIGAWNRQKERQALVMEARAAAEKDVVALTASHNTLETGSSKEGEVSTNGATEDRLAGLKRKSLERQLMSVYDDRIETEKQLAEVYAKWAAQIAVQHRILAHLILMQWMVVAVIVILAILLSALVKRLADRESLDKRRTRTLGWIARLAVQVVALISLLLVVFGPPQQLSTVIGLVTAGLTVALQDFILAFVGWFILMGRNGIGVGDVVEINAVAGEVVDIGLFRTTLLETGNWTAKGHPTGRRVAFNNKFAISGQYFNFSTSGQWMWDELTVSVPAGEDTAATTERVLKMVTAETKEDAQKAEAEWKQVSLRHGLSQFSAEPAVNLRPSGAGVDLVVRYVTRASGRFERRNTLYQCVLGALHGAVDGSTV